MCGRFTLQAPLSDLAAEFDVSDPSIDFDASYNIAPSQAVLAVLNEDDANRFRLLRWGLIPHWAKDPAIGNRMINARAETITEKPSFRNPFKERRCLIVADGFYEWKREGKTKVPVYLRLKSKKPFGFAGLHERWTSPEGEEIRTCTIITTEPNELMKPIHNRMPVIIPKEDRMPWLDPSNQDTAHLVTLLRPYPSSEMEAYPVSKFVNSPANDSPDCVTPTGK